MSIESFIIDGARSPIGTKNGQMVGVRSDDLAAQVIQGLMQRNTNIPSKVIEDVVVGCAFPEGPQGMLMARSISVLAERDPGNLPWGKLGVDVVIESTGFFTSGDKASGHIKGVAKKVIISAPAKGEDITLVMGVNENQYDPSKHNVLSNASCTTNCIAPMAKILDDEFGINHGLMSTIHAYTNDQKVLDQVASDLRRARAAAMNIIPTSTGAAKAVGLVLPHLNGKIHGMAYRVPTSTVSVTDFTAVLNKSASVDDINNAYKKSAESTLKGILEYTDEPLVSSDFKQNTHSTIIDGPSTMSMDGSLVKVVGWYDNEWGYSCRTADLTNYISKLGF